MSYNLCSSFFLWSFLSLIVQGTLECKQSNSATEIERVLKILTLEGYVAEEGEISYVNSSQVSRIPFPNQGSAYGVFTFKSVFGEPSVFPLAGSDAVLFHGCTPPKVSYFGFRSYYTARVFSQDLIAKTGNVTIVSSDMGDTVNHLVIRTFKGKSHPFDSLTTYVTTGDQHTFRDIQRAFAFTPFKHTLNLDVIPSNYLDLLWSANILQTPRDSFSVAFRAVEPTSGDVTDYLTYLSTPQKVYRIRSVRGILGKVSPRIPLALQLRNSLTGSSESSIIGGCLDDLVTSVKQLMAPKGYALVSQVNMVSQPGTVLNQPLLSTYIFEWGIWCIENHQNCITSNRDTLYAWVPQAYFLRDDLFYFVVGVNHNKLDTTVYNSITTYYVVNPLVTNEIYTPISSLLNSEYELFDFKTVVPPGQCTDQQRDNLFVAQVARPQACIPGIAPMCVDTNKLTNTQPFVFFSRANLNPKSATHPDVSETILPKVLVFKKV